MDSLNFFFSDDPVDGKVSSLTFSLNHLSELKDKDLETSHAYCMYWWAIVDMLSRFYSGQLDNQRATKRLKDFVKAYIPHQPGETQMLIHFRNACMHSVNLFSSDLKSGSELRFSMSNSGKFITKQGSSIAINTTELIDRLNEAIIKYKRDVESNDLTRSRFEKVFRKMGYVRA